MCPKMRPVGVAKKRKKGQKLSCVKLAVCPDHPRRRRPLKFCMRGRVREVVICFKFHENRSRGFRVVESRKSPSPIDLAHGLYNSLYYRTSRDKEFVQAATFEYTLVISFKQLLCITQMVIQCFWIVAFSFCVLLLYPQRTKSVGYKNGVVGRTIKDRVRESRHIRFAM